MLITFVVIEAVDGRVIRRGLNVSEYCVGLGSIDCDDVVKPAADTEVS